MNNLLTQYNLFINENTIIDTKGKPKVPNELFENLLLSLQNDEITDKEYELYGLLVNTLSAILLNNQKIKFQDEAVKDECKLESNYAICKFLPKYFDQSKGSKAYSYAFRIGYTAMIHVLEKHNQNRDLDNTLKEIFEEELQIANSARKVTNANLV